MAAPAPPANNHSVNSSDSPGLLQGTSCSVDEVGTILYLIPPLPASSLERRAFDVRRRRLKWSEGSPIGLYWNGDVDPLRPFSFMGHPQADVNGSPAELTGDSPGRLAPSLKTVQDPTSLAAGSFELSAGPSPDTSDSECSLSLSTPPDSPERPSWQKDKRRAAAPRPNVLVRGQLIEVPFDHVDNEMRIARQGYMLEVTVFQQGEDNRRICSPCKLHVDTGSNSTWVLGMDYCEAILSEEETKGIPTKVTLKNWDPSPPREHHVLAPNPVGRDAQSPQQDIMLPSSNIIIYHDLGIAALAQSPTPLEFTIKQFYNWSQTRWKMPKVFRGYRFALAYAVDCITADNYTNGSLGLGLSRRQEFVPTTHPERSFLSVLASQALSSSSADDPNADGFTLYVACRPPWVNQATDPSWLGLNNWPGRSQVDFCERIPVHERDGEISMWTVMMEEMALYRITSSSSGTQRRREHLETTPLTDKTGNGGVLVDLDTGSSTTELPMTVVRSLTAKIPGAVYNVPGGYYEVSRPSDRAIELEIDFTFRGEGDTHVTVTAPAQPFLYEHEGGGGLLFAATGEPLLGVNFFQAMLVAMHRPDDRKKVPYVRFAGQSASTLISAALPSKSTWASG